MLCVTEGLPAVARLAESDKLIEDSVGTCGCGLTVGLLPSKQFGASSTLAVRSNCQGCLAMHLTTVITG